MNTKRIIAFGAILLGFFMALIDSNIVNIALPEITKYYHSNMENISWIMNGYNLAFAVFLITASRIADQFGRKKLFIIGIIVFTFSSMMAALSVTVGMLIFFRVIQGLAAAIIVPVTVPLATEIFPPEERGTVVGIWAAVSGLAAASGPVLGGLLTANFKWHSIFFVNIPVGIITIILAAIFLKESYDPTATRKIDFGGIISITIAIFCVTLALIKANDFGWGSIQIVSLFIISFIALIAFIIIEIKSKEPMLPMWLLKIVPFDGVSLTLLLLGAGIMSTTFLLSFFLTQVMNMTILQAGLTLSTIPFMSMFFSILGGPLAHKYGGRWFIVLGTASTTISIFFFSNLNAGSSQFDIVWRLAVIGAGLGLAMSAVMMSVVRNVPGEKIGIGSGVSNMARALGSVLGIAIIVTFLNSNISIGLDYAKDKAADLIKSDRILTVELKDQIQKTIHDLKPSSISTSKINSDFMTELVAKNENEAMGNSAQADKKAIEQTFDVQKKEVIKIGPEVQNAFKANLANAFSKAFIIESILFLIGVVFGFFSDKRNPKKKEVEDIKEMANCTDSDGQIG
jgi:EmrB/QacA subfamily drug resistance transporter